MEFKIATVSVKSGAKGSGTIKAAETFDGSAVEIPFFIINGLFPGPKLYLGAAIHGIELTGIEVIRRVMEQISPDKLNGAVIAVPVQNPLSLRGKVTKFTPHEYADMNSALPGKPQSGLTDRMAYILWKEVISKADYVIDIHTGVDAQNCFIYTEGPAQKSLELAKAFGLNIIIQSEEKFTVPKLVIELGESGRIEERWVEMGVLGVENVLKHLGMIKGEPEELPKEYVISDKWVQVYSPYGGLYFPMIELGSKVSKGETVAKIYNLYSLKKTGEVIVSTDGYVVRVMTPSVISEGARVIALAGT
ncbi:hypothetical protein A2W24_03780 [Microgenomates group bacterium RBG_16_45_19]|nr:MAG: hypothetical protein A2W24_03780 [Microgenomates group bacterium RBG_16_45_19]